MIIKDVFTFCIIWDFDQQRKAQIHHGATLYADDSRSQGISRQAWYWPNELEYSLASEELTSKA